MNDSEFSHIKDHRKPGLNLQQAGHGSVRERTTAVALADSDYGKIVQMTREGDTDAAEILMKLENRTQHQLMIDDMDDDEYDDDYNFE